MVQLVPLVRWVQTANLERGEVLGRLAVPAWMEHLAQLGHQATQDLFCTGQECMLCIPLEARVLLALRRQLCLFLV